MRGGRGSGVHSGTGRVGRLEDGWSAPREEEAITKCAICWHGEIQAGQTTVTLERGRMLGDCVDPWFFRGVPAQVCACCGESYSFGEVTAQLLQEAEEAVRAGVQVTMREFV